MCSVEKLLIKGIRSFSPENDHAIVFPKPLTLIVGRNGAGKTVRVASRRASSRRDVERRVPRISLSRSQSFRRRFFFPASPCSRARVCVLTRFDDPFSRKRRP